MTIIQQYILCKKLLGLTPTNVSKNMTDNKVEYNIDNCHIYCFHNNKSPKYETYIQQKNKELKYFTGLFAKRLFRYGMAHI